MTRISGSLNPRFGASISANTGPARPSTQSVASDEVDVRVPSLAAARYRDHDQPQRDDCDRDVDQEDRAPGPAEISQPPTSGPIRKAIPVQAVHAPIAAPRSSPLKVTVIVASAAGVSSAPATPCSARATMSAFPPQATAQSTEVTRECDDADDEDAPLAVDVAERSADEDQRAEREQVGVDDPLLEREAAAEISLHRRQRDLDDGGVDEHDRRPQDAGRERQPLARPFAQIADTSAHPTANARKEAAMPGYTVTRLNEVDDVLGDYPGEMRMLTTGARQ